ncbi:putative asparagine synthetase [Chytridium lagenaria]|nr:putative asparagine synthetase [Chytridium lagenaria]
MCGIFAAFGLAKGGEAFRERAVALSKKIRHRGPDWSGVKVAGKSILCHERLAIVGVDSGAQPLTNEDETVFLTVNGEIYNHVTLRKQLKNPAKFKTHSDCEVILHMYEEMGADLVNHLDGMFSFVLYDSRKDLFLAARDHVGITTLYQGWRSSDNSIWFASEMKSSTKTVTALLPSLQVTTTSPLQSKRFNTTKPKWYGDIAANVPPLEDEGKVNTEEQDKEMYTALRTTLEKSVKKRLMSEVPYGVLLSGGKKDMEENAEEDDDIRSAISSAAAWPRLHSFSIGLPGSPDLKAALRVAQFLKTVHHGYTFTAMGVKMVLSGEGSDEIFGGYLYFHNSPNAQALHHECITRIQNLHTSDNLRANKSTMAWGLEARVPFLDRQFLDAAMLQVPPTHKLSRRAPYNHYIEKYVLRKAFDTPEDPYLPEDILWRQKEQFSDGVGYSWIDQLKAHSEATISDEDFARAAVFFPHDTPTTKEAFWYRRIFEKHYPQRACLESVVRWIPRKDWGCSEDPSGRAQAAHNSAYQKNAAGEKHVNGSSPAAKDAKKQKVDA